MNKTRFLSWYRQFFSIDEFAKDSTLLYITGVFLLTTFVTFTRWLQSQVYSPANVISGLPGDYACWPYWLECGDWYFLRGLPDSYMASIFFVGLLYLIFASARAIIKRDFVAMHIICVVLFVVKVFGVFFLTFKESGNYDYYDIIFAFVILFLPYKIVFLRLAFIVLYFTAAPIKFDEGWILAQYFTSMKLGLPIFPESITPLVTNFATFLQVVVAWFLLSSRPILQKTAYILFGLFHVYSGIIVEYRYLLSTIPILYLLFSDLPAIRFHIPKSIRALPGVMFLIALVISQIWVTIGFSADRKLTLEGNRYTLYMFEANHQCQSQIIITDNTGKTFTYNSSSNHARARCDPYKDWFFIHTMCTKDSTLKSIFWVYDHSVNGGPFYRIVDTQDACSLQYKPFSHNSWIRDDRTTAPIIGYPTKNPY